MSAERVEYAVEIHGVLWTNDPSAGLYTGGPGSGTYTKEPRTVVGEWGPLEKATKERDHWARWHVGRPERFDLEPVIIERTATYKEHTA